MQRRTLCFSLLALSLSGCSQLATKNQADGGFDYLKSSEAKPLEVPADLDNPKYTDDYVVSENINQQGPVGEKVDIRAPALVIPVASGSRIELGSKSAKLWFDQVDDSRDLQMQLVKAIEDYLKAEDVSFRVVDMANKTWESDWFSNERTSGWLWTDLEELESMRFRYQIERKPHGRSVALTVTLVDYMKTDTKKSTREVGLIDKQRAEVTMVNAIGAQMDYQYRLNNRENQLLKANQEIVVVGESSNGEPAYVIDMPIKAVWENLPIFFDRYNFQVTDLNESKNIYFVKYLPVDVSLWDSLWGDDIGTISLPEGDYEYRLTETDDGRTALVIVDDQGNNLDAETVNELFEEMGPALTFN